MGRTLDDGLDTSDAERGDAMGCVWVFWVVMATSDADRGLVVGMGGLCNGVLDAKHHAAHVRVCVCVSLSRSKGTASAAERVAVCGCKAVASSETD